MKKIIVGIMSIIGVVAFSQLITKTDENLNSQGFSPCRLLMEFI